MIRMTSAVIAVILALAAGPAWAQSDGEGGEKKAEFCGQRMMSEGEIRQLREQLATAGGGEERTEIRREHVERMRMRAEERNMTLDSPACDLGR